MADVKFLDDSFYRHKENFFRENGEYLVNKFVSKYCSIYKERYQSSKPRNNDFEQSDLFSYITHEVKHNLGSDYSIYNETGLHNEFLYYKESRRKEIISKYAHYGFSMFCFRFSATNIPIKIRELLNCNYEIIEEYYSSCIENHVKQHFLRGGAKLDWIKIDLLYKNGFNQYLSQIKYRPYQLRLTLEDDLLFHLKENGYGYLNNADLYSTYYDKSGKLNNIPILKFDFFNRDSDLIRKTMYTWDFTINPIDYLPNKLNLNEYISAKSSPENIVRQKLGLPKIGEGWISETKLFYQLQRHFNKHVVIHHGRIKWLGRQHFDIYFPELNIAVEYQGQQHYESIEFFGGDDAFKKNIQRDNLKRKKCLANNCDLIYVNKDYAIEDVISNIEKSNNFSRVN